MLERHPLRPELRCDELAGKLYGCTNDWNRVGHLTGNERCGCEPGRERWHSPQRHGTRQPGLEPDDHIAGAVESDSDGSIIRYVTFDSCNPWSGQSDDPLRF